MLAGHRVAVDLAADLPMLRLDPVLFEQVLFNLLDNAAKYAPPGSDDPGRRRGATAAAVAHRRCSTRATASRRADLERIFDKFYRVQAGDRKRAGHRARARHLPRLRRGDGRHDHRRQPRATARGAVFTDHAARPGRA